LLPFDAMLRAQEGDADGALRSVQATLMASRAVGDEPEMISQLARMGVREASLSSLERLLAQTEPSADALKELQSRLDHDDKQNLLLIALRGERAGWDRLCQSIQEDGGKLPVMPGEVTGWDRLAARTPGSAARQRAHTLRGMNQVVEAA